MRHASFSTTLRYIDLSDKLDLKKGAEKLDNFIEKVKKLVDKGDLAKTLGQQLTDTANEIIKEVLGGAPLRAFQSFAGRQVDRAALTAETLQPLVAQAIAEWHESDVSAQLLSRLAAVTFHITDLPGRFLGLASSTTIWIDARAAGYGWALGAANNSGRMDLLSAVSHELGHVLGVDHPDPYDVMGATLAPGVSRETESINARRDFTAALTQSRSTYRSGFDLRLNRWMDPFELGTAGGAWSEGPLESALAEITQGRIVDDAIAEELAWYL